MPTPSDIIIRYDGTDITDSVMFESAHFEQNAHAQPGNFSFRVKDMWQTHSFTIGKEVTLTLDGHKLFGGIILIVKRAFAFPVVDTTVIEDVDTRIFEISGADYNIWFDKLILRNTLDYKNAIKFDGPIWDGAFIRNKMEDYFDLPAGIDLTSEVDNVAEVGLKGKYALPTQGSTWRQVMDDLQTRSGATYYIDADKNLHWHAVAKTKHSWGFSDKPSGSLIGCRDVQATQDGSSMVTDAMVWTGNEIFAEEDNATPEGSGLFFKRFPNPPANAEYAGGVRVWTAAQEQQGIDKQAQWGRWQAAEQHFGEGNSPDKGGIRARHMVLGPSGSIYGIEGGLGQPLWNIQLTWFGHDVPSGNHLPAGHLVDIILYTLGSSVDKPLIQLLPMRHCAITFPTIPEDPTGTQTYVQFVGQFGTDYSDHRKLWKALKKGRKTTSDSLNASIPSPYGETQRDTNVSPSYGAYCKMRPSRVAAAVRGPDYDIPCTQAYFGIPYIAGTMRLYVNGLLQRPNVEYREYPSSGSVLFYSVMLPTDQIFAEFRAAGESPYAYY